ncbi:MAG: prepilin-type N-terminal cleavage/methylation domain-containing protein [Clostridiales bacterium]|jgi:prepilin-type N-terminal cleavage/methylation domain-containing protein|nr:prepilin-type N-terminal cleavage/methylation domain-containing protein [Clostridiales bacterium]
MKKLCNTKGFTLVELVVTILILGILMFLVVMRIGSFSETAAERTCEYNRRSLLSTVSLYEADLKVNGKTLTNDMLDLDVDSSEFNQKFIQGAKPQCPDGGIYSIGYFENGEVSIYCSVHAPKP